MITIEKMQIKHLMDIEGDLISLGIQIDDRTRIACTEGESFAAVLDNKAIACGGVVIRWRGVGEAWAVISESMRKHPFTLHKAAVRVLDESIMKHRLHRIQATVTADFGLGCKWLRSLGFEEEGIMKKYDLQLNDHIMYGRVI